MGLILPARLLSFTDYLLMQVYSRIFRNTMHWNNVENLMLIKHLCIQTLCGTASLRRGLHLIGYVRAGILWSILIIIIINFCTAFWGYAAQKRLHVSVELRQIWRFKLSLFSTLLSPSWANDFSISRYSCENTGGGTATLDRRDASMELWRTSSKRVVRIWPAYEFPIGVLTYRAFTHVSNYHS